MPPRQCVDCHVEQQLQPDEHGLHQLPPQRFSGDHEPESRGGEFPVELRAVPHHRRVVTGDVRSLAGKLRTDRGAHTVPPRQCTDCHVNNNYNLTSTTCVSCHLKDFQRRHESEPRGTAALRRPAKCATTHRPGNRLVFDHSKSGFPLTGRTYGAAAPVHRLPRQQQLQHHHHGMCQLPSERLQQRDHPGAAYRLPDDLPAVPRHGAVDRWQV